MTDHEALEALRIVIEAAEPMRLKEQADCLLGTKHRNPIQKAITKLEALRTGQLIPTPSVDDAMVERVARAIDDAYKPEGSIPFAMDFDWMRDMRIAQATAAISAMQVKD